MNMKMKRLMSVLCLLLLLAGLPLLASCQKDEPVEGLVFTSNQDGTCYVSGLGLWEEDELVIPSTSPEGDRVTSIGNYAFRGADLKKITVPDSVETVGVSAFDRCRELESIVLPDSITYIGYDAFYDCTALKEIRIPSKVTELPNELFYGCQALRRVVIPSGVTKIGELAFYGCTSLTHVSVADQDTADMPEGIVLPEGLLSIDKSAFYGCRSLENVTVPSTLSEFGMDAFYGCNGLKGVYIVDLSAWCAAHFYNAAANPLFHAQRMYVNGETSDHLVIPEGVTSIGNYAFSHGDFFSALTLPKGMVTVGTGAFFGCDSLKDLYLAGTRDEFPVGSIDAGSSNEPLTNATQHYEGEEETEEAETAE